MSQETTNKAGGVSFIGLLGLVIGATIASAVFAFPGDFAAAGAGSGAVLVGWLITGIGMLGLCLAFYYLNKLKPELKGGVYSYARAGFGSYVGFNSAWGYWLSELLSNISFLTLLFASVGQFLPLFGVGNNIPSVIGMSVVWWIAIILVLRGTKESTAVNLVSTIAKIIPILVLIVVIIFARAFSFETFMQNFSGSEGGMSFGKQVMATTTTTVWAFTGIEGAVVISGRAKRSSDVGRATVIGFISVFVLYLIISLESMGVMPRAQMAELATPSMAGILEHAIGSVGASIVNLGVVLSLLGAMLGYVIIAAETPFEAARQGVFPKSFARTNKNGAPIVTVLISAGITQLFLIVSVFSSSTYQFFYACAVSTILIPYVCSAAYYMKIAWKREHLTPEQVKKARVFGTVGFVYTVFLVWAAGLVGIMITTILFAPGIIVYAMGQRERGEKILPNMADKAIAAVIVVLMAVSIALMATGTIQVL